MAYVSNAAELMGTRYVESINTKSIVIGKGSVKNNYNFYWIYGSNVSIVTSQNDLYETRHVFDSNKNYLYIDGIQLFTTTYTAFTSEYPIYLFAMADNNNKTNPPEPSTFVKTKFYNSKIYDNGVLERNFIPCYRKSDGVIGLYDMVYGEFYTNQGSGSFIKGSDV